MTNTPNTPNTVGRPQKYNITDKWHEWIEEWKSVTIDTDGEVNLPTIESLTLFLQDKLKEINKYISLNTVDTYGRGEDAKPEFLGALQWIKCEQKKRLLNSGLSGDYNSTIAKLILSSNHGMAEKTEQMVSVVAMPSIKVGGKELEFNIGNDITKDS